MATNTAPAATTQLPTTAGDQQGLTLASMWQSMTELAKDPSVDPEKMRALVELQERMIDRTRSEEFQRDKIAALQEMPVIERDGSIHDKSGKVRSRYSTHELLMGVVQPILNRHNLHLTHDVSAEDAVPRIACVLSHTNGHVEKSGYMAVPIEKPNRTVTMAQAGAMSVTTGKRHATKAFLGIIERGESDAPNVVQEADLSAVGITAEELEHLLAQAEDAAAGGYYADWFRKQTNVVKGWLVDSGNHARFKA